MSLSVGIVGLPNVGKSTLFNALLNKQIALAANYPFATIEPNTGVVPVPDERLGALAEVVIGGQQTSVVRKPEIKPATIKFVDIAGLVEGAHQGEGLGNQFLAHIREVDLICHVVRAFSDPNFSDPNVALASSSVESTMQSKLLEDLATIRTELLLADLATLRKQSPPKATKDREVLARWRATEQLLSWAEVGKPLYQEIKQGGVDQSLLLKFARELGLLTAKPTLYLVNIDDKTMEEGWQQLTTEYSRLLKVSPKLVMPINAKLESQLGSLDDYDRQLYLQEVGLESGGLARVITRAYSLLGLQSFLTAGEKEVRAWTIVRGTTAVAAAGVIHSDFAKNFIKAKVVTFNDFVNAPGWQAAKEQGKLRIEGRDYVMQDGDVVEFMVG